MKRRSLVIAEVVLLLFVGAGSVVDFFIVKRARRWR